MKKSIYTILLCILTLFVSCSKSDPVEDTPDLDGGFVSGTYWPLALHNEWKMIDADGNEQNLLINHTFSSEGKTFYQFKQDAPEGLMTYPLSLGSENGIYTSYYGNTSMNSVSVSAGNIDYINTKAPVGESWTDEMTLNISGAATGVIKFVHKGKIIEKSPSVTIKGKNFKDVLKIELVQNITNSLTGSTQQVIYNIWLASGIGIIYESVKADDEIIIHELVSYSVKS